MGASRKKDDASGKKFLEAAQRFAVVSEEVVEAGKALDRALVRSVMLPPKEAAHLALLTDTVRLITKAKSLIFSPPALGMTEQRAKPK